MKFEMITNPVSGRGKGEGIADRLTRGLERRGHRVRNHLTDEPGDAQSMAARLSPAHRLLIVGGDGTVNEVVNGISLSDPPEILIYPAGTGNVMAGEIGVLPGVRDWLNLATSDRVRWYDVGKFGSRRFLLMVGVGFDGSVVHRFHSRREGPRNMPYYVSDGLQELFATSPPSVKISFEDGTSVEDAGFVQIANVRNYGGPIVFSPDANPKDGLLNVSWLSKRDLGTVISLLTAGALGIPQFHPHFHTRRSRRVEVMPGDRGNVQLDGDPFENGSAEATVHPAAVPVVTPEASSCYVYE